MMMTVQAYLVATSCSSNRFVFTMKWI